MRWCFQRRDMVRPGCRMKLVDAITEVAVPVAVLVDLRVDAHLLWPASAAWFPRSAAAGAASARSRSPRGRGPWPAPVDGARGRP